MKPENLTRLYTIANMVSCGETLSREDIGFLVVQAEHLAADRERLQAMVRELREAHLSRIATRGEGDMIYCRICHLEGVGKEKHAEGCLLAHAEALAGSGERSSAAEREIFEEGASWAASEEISRLMSSDQWQVIRAFVFCLKGFKGKRLHATMLSDTKISGCRHASGPQPVGDDGAPQVVADIFDADLSIQRIMIERGEGNAILYQRISPEGRDEPAPHQEKSRG